MRNNAKRNQICKKYLDLGIKLVEYVRDEMKSCVQRYIPDSRISQLLMELIAHEWKTSNIMLS